MVYILLSLKRVLIEINRSPASVQSKPGDTGKGSPADRRKPLENGHAEVDEAGVRRGENLYNKYYQQQSEQLTGLVSEYYVMQ